LTGFGMADEAAAAASAAAAAATKRMASEQAAATAAMKASEAARQAAAATHPTERAAAASAASAAAAEAAAHSRQAQIARAAEITAAQHSQLAMVKHRRPVTPWGWSVRATTPAGEKPVRTRKRAKPWFGQYGRAAKTVGKGFSTIQHYAETPERYVEKVPVVGTAAKAAKTVVEAPIKAITSLFGLGATPAEMMAAKMAAASSRGICLKNCEKRPGRSFGPCVSNCLRSYPLKGLGETTGNNWLWLAGGVVLLGAVVVMARR
jgi:hypothetical protein